MPRGLPSGQVNIPLQMQNKSMTVLGHVRVLQAATNSDVPEMVRMVRAEVETNVDQQPHWTIGWSVNNSGYIVGRHFSDSFQIPHWPFRCTISNNTGER